MTKTDDRGMYASRSCAGPVHGRCPVCELGGATRNYGSVWRGPSAPWVGVIRGDACDGCRPARAALLHDPARAVWRLYFINHVSPGDDSHRASQTIDLKFGEARRSHIPLQPVLAWKIAGRVDSPPEAVRPVLRLLPEGLEDLGHGAEAATATVGTDGRFVFLNVPAGTYTIDAPRTVSELKSGEFQMLTALRFPSPMGRPAGGSESQTLDVASPGTSYERMSFRSTTPNYLGRASVVVAGHDEDNVIVPLRRGGMMTGHITVDADPNQTTPGLDPAALSSASIRSPRIQRPAFFARTETRRAAGGFQDRRPDAGEILPAHEPLDLKSRAVARP
jgi:hypothetical protein